jgi:excisionase family DNA binding protein
MKDLDLENEIMSTGEVALLLGVTKRHVINLCERGQLAYTMTGTHRRIRQADAIRLRDRSAPDRGGPMTDDQVRSLWLHQVIAAHVVQDPINSLALARTRAEEILAGGFDGRQWVEQWLAIIDQGPEAVRKVLVSTDPLARELRQNSPFSILLSKEERDNVLKASQKFKSKGAVNR